VKTIIVNDLGKDNTFISIMIFNFCERMNKQMMNRKHNKYVYSSLPLKYATWTYVVCVYLADRCIL
jgi:hypothetical protein